MNRYKQVSTWMEKNKKGEWCKHEEVDQVIEQLNQNFVELDMGWQRTYDHDVGRLKQEIARLREQNEMVMDANEEFIAQINQLRKQLEQEVLTLK